MHAPIEFHGGQSCVSDAIRIGWMALREVMRAWRVTTPDELSTWLRNRGFLATRPGQQFVSEGTGIHFPRRLRLGRPCGTVGDSVRVNHIGARSCKRNSTSEQCGPKCYQKNSNQRHPSRGPTKKLDEVDQFEWFLARIPMLKSCPHFIRGRLRQCWAVALRERHRARQVHDNAAAERRAWKLFGLVPVMLLHRPRGSGSVGRDNWPNEQTILPGDIGLHFTTIRAAVLSRCVAQLPGARPRSKPAEDERR